MWLLACVGGRGEPLDEDVDVGATVDDGALAMPEESAPLALGVDVVVVVVSLVTEGPEVGRAGPEAPGNEPGSNANSKRITTTAEPAAIPIPFCRRRMFNFLISYLHSYGRLPRRPHVPRTHLRNALPSSADLLGSCNTLPQRQPLFYRAI